MAVDFAYTITLPPARQLEDLLTSISLLSQDLWTRDRLFPPLLELAGEDGGEVELGQLVLALESGLLAVEAAKAELNRAMLVSFRLHFRPELIREIVRKLIVDPDLRPDIVQVIEEVMGEPPATPSGTV